MMRWKRIWKQSNRWVPGKVWIETSGFLLIGIALLMGLAAYSYDPRDYTQGLAEAWKIRNLAGPVGAAMAHFILSWFGFVGLAWPVLIGLWGLMIITGFTVVPNMRRLIAFLGLTVWLSAIVEIQCAYAGINEPYFGFGGIIGQALALPIVKHFGYGGSLIILVIFSFITLVLTGNLRTSEARENIAVGRYHGYRAARWSIEKLKHIQRYEAQRIAKLREKDLYGSTEPQQKPRRKALDPNKPSGSNPGNSSSITQNSSSQLPPIPGQELELYHVPPNIGRPGPEIFLSSEPGTKLSPEDKKAISQRLTKQLSEFKVFGNVVAIQEGPVVTTFEFEPSPGQKVAKITSLAEDLARLLEAKSLRILAPIPGKRTIGFEVPNAKSRMIGFRDLIESKEFKNRKIELPVAMGLDTSGNPVITDLAAMPHLLVAGSTGSGKSVFMNSLVAGLIYRHTPKTLRFVMVDPKMVEMAAYNKIPHMACPVVTDAQTIALKKLNALVAEMEHRYELMKSMGARNIQGFNDIIKTEKKIDYPKFPGKWQPLPYVVLIIDELADLMMTLGKEVETPIARLAQKARAAGIHMVIATQRPSAEVVTGLIKANFPTRVAFRMLSGIDSRTIIDQIGAESLLGRGDMLYLSSQGLSRLHGAYLSEQEVQSLVKSFRS